MFNNYKSSLALTVCIVRLPTHSTPMNIGIYVLCISPATNDRAYTLVLAPIYCIFLL